LDSFATLQVAMSKIYSN